VKTQNAKFSVIEAPGVSNRRYTVGRTGTLWLFTTFKKFSTFILSLRFVFDLGYGLGIVAKVMFVKPSSPSFFPDVFGFLSCNNEICSYSALQN